MKRIIVLVFISFVAVVQPVMAQQQQQTIVADTLEPPPTEAELANKKIANRTPNKAAMYSALLPGTGQIYNKKYWKAPIVWVGLGITGYLAIDYYNRTGVYGRAATNTAKGKGGDNPSNDYHGYDLQTLTTTQLTTLQDDSRRFMYMNILIFSGIYALNIVDAYVDAHLKEFDVGDNLSFKVKPLFYATNYSHLATGLSLSIRFK
jgi:hypothetical protein